MVDQINKQSANGQKTVIVLPNGCSKPNGMLTTVHEVNMDYDTILRQASTGIYARAARARQKEPEPKPTIQPPPKTVDRTAEMLTMAVEMQVPRLAPLGEATIKANSELSNRPCARKLERSPLTAAQKEQVLSFFSVFRDHLTVEQHTGIPKHFVKHYLNEHERVETVKKAVRVLKADGNLAQAAKNAWHAPNAIKRWLREEGYGHLLKKQAHRNQKAKAAC